MAAIAVDLKKLLEAGAHFGHKTSRWHPKMRAYIHSSRNGSHIIDLTKTAVALEEALEFLAKTVSEGKQVLLVGTKRQAKDIIRKLAEDTGMPFVTERWLGGMLTNQKTIGDRVKHLRDLEINMDSGALANKYSKLELQRYQEEIDRMNFIYGGIKELSAKPGAVFVTDVVHDNNAVREAHRLGLKVVALIDTNADPSQADYPIPCNDDAIKTIQLIADYLKEAIESGRAKAKKLPEKTEDKDKGEEKKAEGKEHIAKIVGGE